MQSQSILYLGRQSGTCLHRANALRRLGHDVEILDPYSFVPAGSWVDKWIFETGGLFLESVVERKVSAALPAKRFDLVYVDGGELIGPSLIRRLKDLYGKVINYNIDDPYGSRDRNKWRLYLQSVPFYDLVVVIRDCNIPEAKAAGAQSVLLVSRAADELAHAPRQLTDIERERRAADVTFIGTWMPERGPFIGKLIQLGLPVTVYGDRWQKAREWPAIAPYWRGAGIYNDHEYALAILASKVCLGLLSKGNRDLSTTRSFEIPYLASVLCAERTSEHVQLYREGEDAVFWSNPEECADKCKLLLGDESWREWVARNGRERCIANGTTNQRVMAQILACAFGESAHKVGVLSSK